MSELIHEASGGPEPGHVHSWFNFTTWICLKKGTDLLVGCGEEVGIIKGIGKGIEVSG